MLQPGQPIGDEKLAKIDFLGATIWGLLRKQKMTAQELVNTLLGEPYGISLDPDNLDLIAMAVDRLQERRLLDADFRADHHNLTIEPVFKTLPLNQGTRA